MSIEELQRIQIYPFYNDLKYFDDFVARHVVNREKDVKPSATLKTLVLLLSIFPFFFL